MANIKQIINGDNKFIRNSATIEFTSDELITLSNALFMYSKGKDNKDKEQLMDIIHIASQVSQYGHMNNWAVNVLKGSIKNNDEN